MNFASDGPFAGDQVIASKRASYRVIKPIGHGGRGITYLAEIVEIRDESFTEAQIGQKVVLKTVRIDRERPDDETATFIGFVNNTLASEYTILRKLEGLNCVARVIDFDQIDITLPFGRPVKLPYLVQEFISGGALTEHLARVCSTTVDRFAGLPSDTAWFGLAIELTEHLVEVHQCEVIHRDIWPPNIMVRDNGGCVYVDFGEAVFRQAAAGVVPTNTATHSYFAPERKGDWLWPSRRADVFSLGAVLYFAATGRAPEFLPIEDNEQLKEAVIAGIRERNSMLLNANWGIADVIARCLRFNPNDRIRDADVLLQEIRIFDWPEIRRLKKPDQAVIETISDQLRQLLEQLYETGLMLFEDIAAFETVKVVHRIESMCNGVFDISGDHEDLVSGMTGYLSVLESGDQYYAITVPDFWDQRNLGIRGRFLSMNRQIGERGVQIRRLFLVTHQELDDSRSLFWEVATAHRELRADMRVKIVTPEEQQQSKRNDRHCGVWVKGESMTKLIPVYEKNGVITLVRIRRHEGRHLIAEISHQIDEGRPLEDCFKTFGR